MIDYSRVYLVGGGWARHAGTLYALTLVRGVHASDYHDAICLRLEQMGWTARREFAVVFGDGQGGRIDVVADRDGDRIALELDNRTPRGKSILKLMTMPKHVPTAVLLRSPK